MNFIKQLKEKRNLSNAVKEALDNLPSAVCYFNANGSVKLCNTAMYSVYRKFAQSELQSFDELTQALNGCDNLTGIIRDGNIFIFPDGRARQYSAKKIKTDDGRYYTEAVFSDVTELYEKRTELERQSEKLKKMYAELKTLSDNLQEVTREQEILNMKMRLHDQMNMGITAIRQILRQNTTSEENASAVAQFRRAIQILQQENTYPQDDFNEFIKDAGVAGVQVKISGEPPYNTPLLVAVMREACVNAAAHADASVLNIACRTSKNTVTLCITNNGNPPEREIIPRGGLKELKRRIESAGGTIKIISLPQFSLTVTLPVSEKNNI